MGAGGILAGAVLVLLLAAIARTDLRSRRIPDPLTLSLGGAGLVHALLAQGRLPLDRIVAGLVAAALLWAVGAGFRRLRGVTGLGRGDIKMSAAAALWISPWNLPLFLIAACLAALLAVAGASLLGRPPGRRAPIPFGPFLGLGLLLVWGLETAGAPTLAPVGMDHR